ncbi:MAG: hypothetical protein G8237_05470 [Magnetococcales bacterium]|nr:hypothetical protein [Magnetococcales bacterium]NGZ05788.1 hypothetical protein [Magnetococcales bacterium]
MKQTMAIGLLVGMTLGGGSGDVAASDRMRQCVLEHVKPARSAVAAQYLQQACARRFPAEPNNPALQIQPEVEDGLAAYDHCLFQQLAGVQNDASAAGMEQLCRDQYHPVGWSGEEKGQSPGFFNWLQRIDGGAAPRSDQQDAPRIDGETFVPLAPAKAGR